MVNQQWSKGHASSVVRVVVGVIVALVVAVPVYFEIVQPVLQGDAPAAAVRQLCADEMRQDYVAVYALLSAHFIAQYGLQQDRFVQQQQGRDQNKGAVQACAIVGRDYGLMLWNTGAAFQVTGTLVDSQALYQYTNGTLEVVHNHYTDTAPIEVVNDHGWKINSEGLDDILYLAG